MNSSNRYGDPIGAKNLDLQTCVMQYKSSKNENLLRVILFKLRGTFNYYLYVKTNYPDKSELLALYEDKLLDCIESFDNNRNAQFVTYFSRCLDNALINFINSTRNDNLLSLNFEYEEDRYNGIPMIHNIPSEIDDLEKIEASLLLESIKNKLSDNEYKVCKIILSETHRLNSREIADELGLTTAAIPIILKRLRKKFNSGMLKETFWHLYKKSH